MPRSVPSVALHPRRAPGGRHASQGTPRRRRSWGGGSRGVAASAVLLSGASALMLSGLLPTGASAHTGSDDPVAVSGSTWDAETEASRSEHAEARRSEQGAQKASKHEPGVGHDKPTRTGRDGETNNHAPGTGRTAPKPSYTPPATPPGPGTLPEPSGSTTLPPATGTLAELAATHVGFGEPQLGGLRTVVVTSAADSGPGTLRAAAAGDAPKHVVFAGDMTIRLASGVPVGSNTVIDGRGREVVVTAPGEDGLVLDGVSNVTIESLTLTGFGNTGGSGGGNDPYDAIRVDGSSDVWIDHNDLSQAGDKLVVVQNGSTGVTVSWNRFHDQAQVMQIGDQHGAAVNVDQTVTVHHNYFDSTGYRHPVVSYGRAHVFNNYYREWDVYAVRSQRAAQVYFERNVLEAGQNTKATLTEPGGDGCNDAGTRCDTRPGALASVENVSLSGVQLRYQQGGSVFDPADFYAYTADRPDAALAERIAAGAGPLG